MLVLTRKTGQSIVIDGGIEITVLEVRGEQVRLGIAAPREIKVNRKELLAQMEAAAAEALETTPASKE
ncbi:MAG TPA: carbon storage regulator CsrA [Armatimonadota bacterium]|nr:carbon storage regulator CsrA [Armatimonadota bacterium]